VRYGISAAGIVVREHRLLLVRHHRPGRFDFWLPPGGGLEGEEGILECAAREVREETGLLVRPGRIAYVEEILEPDFHFCKFFVLCEIEGGQLSLEGRVEEERDFLVDARFFTSEELPGLKLFPAVLERTFWDDLAAGFPETRYLGLHRAQLS
jgi:ADP-ribose pyrophosphatase YjhB (NUDIX family)